MAYLTIDPAKWFVIPRHVAVCPICGGRLIAQIDQWWQDDDGTWRVDDSCGLHLDCMTGMGDGVLDGLDEYLATHWRMPYVDWLPVEVHVVRWFDRYHRIRYDDVG